MSRTPTRVKSLSTAESRDLTVPLGRSSFSDSGASSANSTQNEEEDLELSRFAGPHPLYYTPPSLSREYTPVDSTRVLSDIQRNIQILDFDTSKVHDIECGLQKKKAALCDDECLLDKTSKPLHAHLVKGCETLGSASARCCPFTVTGIPCCGTSICCHFLCRSMCVIITTIIAFLIFVLISESIMYPVSSCSVMPRQAAQAYTARHSLLPTNQSDLVQLAHTAPDHLYLRPNYTAPLRLNHLRILGSHNSYHVASRFRPRIGPHQYSHPTLEDQLNSGIRQLEIDIHPTADGFLVFHLALLDDKATCKCLSECLSIIQQWSQSNPTHSPLTILFELKIAPWEDLRASFTGVTCDLVEKMEAHVKALFNESKIISPSEIRGNSASIRDALIAQVAREKAGVQEEEGQGGWPTLEASRGRIMFGWLDDVHKWGAKMKCAQAPERTLFLVQANPDNPWAALLSLPEPALQAAKAMDGIQKGMIVRTITDNAKVKPMPERFETALRSGAQLVSTDFEQCEPENPRGESQSYEGSGTGIDGRYCERLPSSLPVECAYLTAPADCQEQLMAAYGKGML